MSKRQNIKRWSDEVAALLTDDSHRRRYSTAIAALLTLDLLERNMPDDKQQFSMRDLWLQNLTPTEAANIIREA